MIGIVATGCVERDEPDVLPVLEAVIDTIGAEGAVLRVLDGRLCGSLERCDASERIEPVLRELGDGRGVPVVVPHPDVAPVCGPDIVRDASRDGGYLMTFGVRFIRPDSAVVKVERICMRRPGGPAYAQGDEYDLLREGAAWRVVRVTRTWET